MRHKKVKNLDSRMAAVQDYLVTDIGGSALKVKETAAKYKGNWREYFASLQETAEPAASPPNTKTSSAAKARTSIT